MEANIVVIRAGALGDIILTLPALQALRLRHPDASLRVVGYRGLWEIAGSLVDEVVSIDALMFAGLFTGSPSAQLCDWLRDVDLVVAWTARDPRPALEECRVPHVVHASPYPPSGMHASDWLVDSGKGQLTCLPDAASPVGPVPLCQAAVVHAAEQWEATGTSEDMSRGGAAPVDRPMLTLMTEELERGREILAGRELKQPIAIHPGAGASWKRWPAERFAALAQELIRWGHQVVLIEGPADTEAVNEVQLRLAAETPVLRQQPLRVLAGILAQCALFVGNDSGVTHLAAAAGAPTIALFGPTDPSSWAPRGSSPGSVRVLRHCERRTAHQGQIRVCDDPDCMEGIEVAEVLETVETLATNVQNPVENPRFSVDNFVDRLSTGGADSRHHHFDRPSSEDVPRT